MTNLLLHPLTITWAAHAIIVAALGARVIMKRPAVGVALAWLVLIVVAPFGGAVIYLLIGERRIGDRGKRYQKLRIDYHKVSETAIGAGLLDIDWSRHVPAARAMNNIGKHFSGLPTVRGSTFELLSDTQEILAAIVRDVDAATTSVLMEFYIWNEGGAADDVIEALIRAARRGVLCRLLIDAFGARPWWKSRQPQRLRDAGVDVRPCLPTGLFRLLVGRTDLRLHRKIVVIDGTIAWTGSMNLVDPRFFKQDAGVGEWVDAMVRLQGSVVVPLAATMTSDWILESGERLDEVMTSAGLRFVEPRGTADIQVVPSGPGQSEDGLLQMILALINSAQKELVLTTPYLVPDESLLRAIRGAAGRGVRVRLIVPEKVDSLLTRYASRSCYEDLLEVGVEIHLFQAGLLHTKAITVDSLVSMFGTANLDMRSFWLNYEVSLFVYDQDFSTQLRCLQQSYIDASAELTAEAWAGRSLVNRFLENLLRLFSPLL